MRSFTPLGLCWAWGAILAIVFLVNVSAAAWGSCTFLVPAVGPTRTRVGPARPRRAAFLMGSKIIEEPRWEGRA